jgi:hypothetical protein
VTGAIADEPTGRAILEAARERRVGAVVYLRYAAEVGPTEDVVAAAAAAAEFAALVLGPAVDVYAAVAATGGQRAATSVAHIALTVRHTDGSTSLLGIGRRGAEAAPTPASILLVGDRGVAEGHPPPVLPGGETHAVGVAAAATGDEGPPAARATLVETIRRALSSGKPEAVAGDAGGATGG